MGTHGGDLLLFRVHADSSPTSGKSDDKGSTSGGAGTGAGGGVAAGSGAVSGAATSFESCASQVMTTLLARAVCGAAVPPRWLGFLGRGGSRALVVSLAGGEVRCGSSLA